MSDTNSQIVSLVTTHFLETGEGMTRRDIEKAFDRALDLYAVDEIKADGPRWVPTISHLRTIILAAR